MHEFELIVVGLGAMGSAVAYHAAERGLNVLGLDQYAPPHTLGSTHAESRVTRLAVGEGPQYLPFVKRSHEIWIELEERTGVELLYSCGGLIVTEQEPVAGQRWEDFVTETARIADLANIDYEILEPTEARERFPWMSIPADRKIGYEPTAGLVMPERCVQVQLDLAQAAGATLRLNERVAELLPDADGVTIKTDSNTYRAENVVLATGAWFGELAAQQHAEQVSVTRQVVYWFDADDQDVFDVARIPFVMWIAESDEDYMALFPRPPGMREGVKLLGEQFLETTDARSVNREVSQAEMDEFFDLHVAGKFEGIRRECLSAEVCLYTNTPDDNFLIDVDPRSERILVMSPCSGHGFKHSTALGEAVAQQIATGSSVLDLSPFRYSR